MFNRAKTFEKRLFWRIIGLIMRQNVIKSHILAHFPFAFPSFFVYLHHQLMNVNAYDTVDRKR